MQDSSSILSPYYERQGITIYHGDCLTLLPLLRADICITDPPYNTGKNYGRGTNDRRAWDDWASWMDSWLALALLSCRDGVLCFLSQTAYRQYVRLGKHEMFWSAVWIKPLSLAVCAAPFLPHHEFIAYWGSKRKQRGDLGWGSDVISCNVEFGKSRRGHPTPKPLSLMRDIVSRTQGTVLDPFMGSGTTLRAAKDLGRAAIGVEIEERFCRSAVSYMAQEVLKGAPA